MRRMLVVMNHPLTPEQVADAKESLRIDDFVYMPDDLQKLWGQIDPAVESISDLIHPIKAWIMEHLDNTTFVLVQGDVGAVCHVVRYLALAANGIPDLYAVYATTARQAVETTLPDGTVQKTSVFKHIRFRKYF